MKLPPSLLLLLFIMISVTSCSPPTAHVIETVFLPYNPNDHGKFVIITLDRPLVRNERYAYQIKLRTKSGRSLNECEGILANDTVAMAVNGAQPAKSFRENLFNACIHNDRNSYRFLRETVEEHVGPGLVDSLIIKLGHDENFAFRELGTWTFGPR